MLPGCCDCFNDKAMRAGRGAAFRLPLAGGDWQELQRVLEAHDLVPVAAHPHPQETQQPGELEINYTRHRPRSMTVSSDEVGWAACTGDDAFAELRQQNGVALILGSEGQGLCDATLARCRRVSIPMHRMESLNVAVAGSILMWAIRP